MSVRATQPERPAVVLHEIEVLVFCAHHDGLVFTQLEGRFHGQGKTPHSVRPLMLIIFAL